MHCAKCKTSIQDKKFQHPVHQDEYLCFNCFDRKLNDNRVTLSRNISLGANITEGGIKEDIMLKFVLCTSGKNSNKDGFDDEGLLSDYKTVINQRLDWEHTDEVVGTVVDSEFIDASDSEKIKQFNIGLNKSFVAASALLWKVWNFERAQEVVARHRFGTLFYSMEDVFDYCICSECRNEYAFDDEYCEHLSGRYSINSGAFRILRGNKFVGAGIVKQPADRNAVGLSLAKNKLRHKIIAEILTPDVYDYWKYMTDKMR